MIAAKDLEHAFDAMFFNIGFQRVSDMVGQSPDFKNADYIRMDQKVIVELKIIDKDFFKDGGIIDRLHGFIPIREDGRTDLPPNSPGQYHFTLPPTNRESRHDTIEEPLRRVLKKANRQIKETNQRLLNGEGLGVILIALNMETRIQLNVITALAESLLAIEFSSIPGFLVCDPVLAINGDDVSCIHGVKQEMPDDFELLCSNLGDYFCDFFYQIGSSEIE